MATCSKCQSVVQSSVNKRVGHGPDRSQTHLTTRNEKSGHMN